MPHPHELHGQLAADGTTGFITCRGYATLSAHLASGTGTWTWQYQGLDGAWRPIYGGPEGTTGLQFTVTNMQNVFFGNDTRVRGVASSGASAVWDWEIRSNLVNR